MKIVNLICNFIFCIIHIIFIIAIFFNQTKKAQNHIVTLTGKTMGTYWQVKIPKLKNQVYIKKIIQKYLNKDEDMLSSWKKNSIVSQFNRIKKNQPQIINKKFFRLISTALKINKKTNGKLDITIGSLINIWGFGTEKKPNNYISKKKLKKYLNLSGSQHLKLIKNSSGMYLEKDINGIEINLSTLGEGFAADHISYILKKKGIKNYTVSIGGAVVVKTEKNQKKSKIIAIQKPTDKEISIHLLICLKNHSISTAGSYRNYYYLKGKHISHLIDPSNGKPVTHNLVSVSVIAKTALEADSWDTGLLIAGFKKAKEIALKENLAVCLITQKKNIFSTWISPKFKKFLIKKNNFY
ncbi:FAD:protein FMN transferase [Buchnera aphidicola]|uniref:FAD:protein FMN transferase n=1 Tax=Buchnera aphidicola (Artemisaphis artemisicola) TaxID=1241836 RepID=A0A4D6XHJ8_9GAMM|nr:FAD:protein FMN transferase [Buchnera aphidicola]QCI15912.1 FAD:protein FMN transferase ApbE [Buchnera aphidicola (Artemisaphis artemisicola)]